MSKLSDRDNDSIPDANDRCPDEWGYRKYGGCLESKLTRISILTSPSSALLEINGNKYYSPRTIQLEKGRYICNVSLNGFRDTSISIHVQKDTVISVNLNEDKKYGYVKIVTTSQQAKVFINNKQLSQNELIRGEAGSYQLSIRHPYFQDVDTSIRIIENDTVEITKHLYSKNSTLNDEVKNSPHRTKHKNKHRNKIGHALSFYYYSSMPHLYGESTVWENYSEGANGDGIDYAVLIRKVEAARMGCFDYSVELSRLIKKIPQLFADLHFEGGWLNIEGNIAHGVDVIFVDIDDVVVVIDTFLVTHTEKVLGGLNLACRLGVRKKFYLRRFSLDLGVDGGAIFTSLMTESGDWTIQDTILNALGYFDSSGTYLPTTGLIYTIAPVVDVNLGIGLSVTSNIAINANFSIPVYTDFNGWNYSDSDKDSDTYESEDGATSVTVTEETNEKRFEIPGNGFKFSKPRILLKLVVEF